MKHLPRTCSEQDIRGYVADLIGTAPRFGVAAVNMAYDNEREIKDCTYMRPSYTPYHIMPSTLIVIVTFTLALPHSNIFPPLLLSMHPLSTLPSLTYLYLYLYLYKYRYTSRKSSQAENSHDV